MLQLILIILSLIITLEIIILLLVKFLRLKFQWLITLKDEIPVLDKEGLKKFMKFGYDSRLGWIRKPNTSHKEKGKYGETIYHINEFGSRFNPDHQNLENLISCFGDSFTFSRQVNDNETWEWYLSEKTKSDVSNFGVGNYGMDQAYLRLEKEIDTINSKIIILGVVPSTIVRNLAVWKHYNEFGNTFGFKPRFDLKNGNMVLIDNIINSESKFDDLSDYLTEIQNNDYFYKTKFKDEMIRFPYLYHVFRKPKRNIPLIGALVISRLLGIFGIKISRLNDYPLMKIMNINLDLRYKLYYDHYAKDIMAGIIDKFVSLGEEKKFTPIFLLLPQKDDLIFIKENGKYYSSFINKIKEKLFTIDITETLLDEENINDLYSDDNVYGGHFSKEGNQYLAEILYKKLKEKKIIS